MLEITSARRLKVSNSSNFSESAVGADRMSKKRKSISKLIGEVNIATTTEITTKDYTSESAQGEEPTNQRVGVLTVKFHFPDKSREEQDIASTKVPFTPATYDAPSQCQLQVDDDGSNKVESCKQDASVVSESQVEFD
jgi:hypothetical protein